MKVINFTLLFGLVIVVSPVAIETELDVYQAIAPMIESAKICAKNAVSPVEEAKKIAATIYVDIEGLDQDCIEISRLYRLGQDTGQIAIDVYKERLLPMTYCSKKLKEDILNAKLISLINLRRNKAHALWYEALELATKSNIDKEVISAMINAGRDATADKAEIFMGLAMKLNNVRWLSVHDDVRRLLDHLRLLLANGHDLRSLANNDAFNITNVAIKAFQAVEIISSQPKQKSDALIGIGRALLFVANALYALYRDDSRNEGLIVAFRKDLIVAFRKGVEELQRGVALSENKEMQDIKLIACASGKISEISRKVVRTLNPNDPSEAKIAAWNSLLETSSNAAVAYKVLALAYEELSSTESNEDAFMNCASQLSDKRYALDGIQVKDEVRVTAGNDEMSAWIVAADKSCTNENLIWAVHSFNEVVNVQKQLCNQIKETGAGKEMTDELDTQIVRMQEKMDSKYSNHRCC